MLHIQDDEGTWYTRRDQANAQEPMTMEEEMKMEHDRERDPPKAYQMLQIAGGSNVTGQP